MNCCSMHTTAFTTTRGCEIVRFNEEDKMSINLGWACVAVGLGKPLCTALSNYNVMLHVIYSYWMGGCARCAVYKKSKAMQTKCAKPIKTYLYK